METPVKVKMRNKDTEEPEIEPEPERKREEHRRHTQNQRRRRARRSWNYGALRVARRMRYSALRPRGPSCSSGELVCDLCNPQEG